MASVKQMDFHTILINTLKELLTVCEKYRKDPVDKFAKKFDVLSLEVEQALKNYDVKQLRFTTRNNEGNLVYIDELKKNKS